MTTLTKQKIKRWLAKIYYPIFLLKAKNKNCFRLIILMYHSINSNHPASVRPKDFEKQIKWLKDNYSIVNLWDPLNFQEDSVAITFDDGYEDNFIYAFPILKKYNCPATIFVATGFIKKETDITKQGRLTYTGLRPLTSEQILEMSKDKISFGSHTHTHPVLSKISFGQAASEIIQSKKFLENILNQSITLFAYPNGQRKDFNASTQSVLRQNGFLVALSTIWGDNNKNTPQLVLRRIRVDAEDSFEDFKNKVLGGWDFVGIWQALKSWL